MKKDFVNIRLGFDMKEECAEVAVEVTQLFNDMVTDFGIKEEVFEKLEKMAVELNELLSFVENKGRK